MGESSEDVPEFTHVFGIARPDFDLDAGLTEVPLCSRAKAEEASSIVWMHKAGKIVFATRALLKRW
jgi:hypothetical protein